MEQQERMALIARAKTVANRLLNEANMGMVVPEDRVFVAMRDRAYWLVSFPYSHNPLKSRVELRFKEETIAFDLE